jgi:hypothetical protein
MELGPKICWFWMVIEKSFAFPQCSEIVRVFVELAASSRIYTWVHGPYVFTSLNWTPILERHLTRLVLMSGQQKDTCYIQVEACFPKTNITLNSTINTIGRTYVVT